jgi:phage shock protein C
VTDQPPGQPEQAGRGETGGAPTPRLLRRSRTDRVIAGVCGGVGRYLGVDPVLIRVAFVVLAIAGGSGILLYVLGWILIPEEKEGEQLGEVPPSSSDTARLVFGAALIGVGVILLLGLSLPHVGKYLWPLALIAIGVAVIVQAIARR